MPGRKPPSKGGGATKDYRHTNKRKNIPPAKIAAKGCISPAAKVSYSFNHRQDPKLQYDSTGKSDLLKGIVKKALKGPINEEEASLLDKALLGTEPWLEWASKLENNSLEIDPVALHMHERICSKASLRAVQKEDLNRNFFADPQYEEQEAIQFYQHEMDWTNRLILGDCLQVMSSLSQRENLAGKVQMIYLDPPYGISFSSNFQVKANSLDVKDREADLTRELEMVKAYRDTWKLRIHSYLTYLRARFRVAKELLHDSGSIFIQINDKNLHLVAMVADEVFGSKNRIQTITFTKKSMTQRGHSIADYLLWYSKDKASVQMMDLYRERGAPGKDSGYQQIELPTGERVAARLVSPKDQKKLKDRYVYQNYPVVSQEPNEHRTKPIVVEGKTVYCGDKQHWRFDIEDGMRRLEKTHRLKAGKKSASGIVYWGDGHLSPPTNVWTGFHGATDPTYVVQTNHKIIEQCILMTTAPGDLVLDPTCGGGTTAYAAEKWGRRWITIDTSRVAIYLARKRLMTSSFQYYKLKDKDLGVSRGFCCETISQITHKSIANNSALDPIFDKHDPILDGLLDACNNALTKVDDSTRKKLHLKLKEKNTRDTTDGDKRRWRLPPSSDGFKHYNVPFEEDCDWPPELQKAVSKYRVAWRKKMAEVNQCIQNDAAHVELIDKPLVQNKILRVCGPFSVDSVLPPEALSCSSDKQKNGRTQEAHNCQAYVEGIIALLRKHGLFFSNEQEMKFEYLDLVSGRDIIHAAGEWTTTSNQNKEEKNRPNVAVVCGPQHGPVTALQVDTAIQYSTQHGFTELVIAGFSFDGAAQAAIDEANNNSLLIHVAHISPDVSPSMKNLLRSPRYSQIFNVFGRPEIDISNHGDNSYCVELKGVSIYDPIPNTVTSENVKDIAAWFLDTDYDGRTFCSVQIFFPNQNAWEGIEKALGNLADTTTFEKMKGFVSCPFALGKHSTIAVKVIDFRGNEAMAIRKITKSNG